MNQPKVVLALRLMKMLQNNSTLTIDEIAARLEVVPRTIYRYIDTLKESGFTVINIKGDIYSLVEMPQPAPEFDKLVYFSDEESYLVNNLIDALSPTNALKAGLRKKLAVIYDNTGIEGFVDRKSNAAHVAKLRKAAQEKKMNNAIIENRNSIIKCIKKNANGYTNWTRFRNRVLYVLDKNSSYSMYPMKKEKKQ